MIRYSKGEIKNAWVRIEDRDSASFTITNDAVFEVFDKDGSSVQAETGATISSDKIYGLVDTTASAFVDGDSYEVKFTYHISGGSETLIAKTHIKLTETKI